MRKHKTLILLIAALLVRLFYYSLSDPVINNDPYIYLKLASYLAAGNFSEGLDTYWSPLYPLLIALVSLVCGSLWWSILIVSFVAGSLATLAVYYLVKQFYGEREAIIGAVIAIFYPHLTNSTADLWAENLYLLFVTFALIMGWKGLTKCRAANFLLTGILLGLAYLTRPEAFGYLFFFITLAVCQNVVSRKTITLNTVKNCGVLLAGFALMAAPYIFYLRSTTGVWTISEKFRQHIVGASYASNDVQEARYLNNARLSTETPSKDINDSGRPSGLRDLLSRGTNIVYRNLYGIHKRIPHLFPPFLFVLIGLGLFRRAWARDRLLREIYLFSFCALTVLGYALTVVEVRYFYVLLPVLIGWTARGIVELEIWLRDSLRRFSPERTFTPIFFIPCVLIILINVYIFQINTFMRTTEAAWEFSAFEQKRAGIWLKENARPSPAVMSLDFRPAFYAAGEHILLPVNDAAETVRQAALQKADFLIIAERNLKYAPQLSGLLNYPQNYSELEPVYQSTDQPEYKIVIYKVKSETVMPSKAAQP